MDPTLLLADSKANAVAVQQHAVNKAANSPRCDENIYFTVFAVKVQKQLNVRIHS